jgi:hypothetical protein
VGSFLAGPRLMASDGTSLERVKSLATPKSLLIAPNLSTMRPLMGSPSSPELDEGVLAEELKDLRTPGLRRRSDRVALPVLETIARLLDPTGTRINDQIKTAITLGSEPMADFRRLAVREVLDAGNQRLEQLGLRRRYVARQLKVTTKAVEAQEEGLFAELARHLVRLAPEPPPLPTASVEETTDAACDGGTEDTDISATKDGRKRGFVRPQQRRPAVVFSLSVLAALTVGLVLLLGNNQAPAPGELERLAQASERNLTGDQAPVPGTASRVLGFGDPTPEGRTVYPYVAHETEGVGTPASPTPTLDALTDVPGFGDEREFLHLATGTIKKPPGIYINRRSVFLRADEDLWLSLYIDNGAAEHEHNCSQLTGPTIAQNTTVGVAMWDSPNRRLHIIRGWIYASNAQPTWITDAVAVLTEQPRTLEMVPRRGSQYSELPAQYHGHIPLTNDTILQSAGMRLEDHALLGSCWQNRVDVFYSFTRSSKNLLPFLSYYGIVTIVNGDAISDVSARGRLC